MEWTQNQGLDPKRKKVGKQRAAKTSAFSVAASAAAELGGGSGKAVLPPTGNLPKRATFSLYPTKIKLKTELFKPCPDCLVCTRYHQSSTLPGMTH